MRAANRRSARSGTLPKPLWTKPPLDFSTTLHPLQLLGPHFTDVEYYCPNQQAREHHREGASEGPVAGLEELLLDQVSRHHRTRTAEQVRDDELPSRRYEDQDAPRYDSRHAQGEGDPPEGMPPARPEVLSSLLQPHVELLESRVEWQDHERQIRVNHAHENCPWGEDEVYGTVGDAEELERTVGDAIAAQDHHPGVGPQEQTGPERNHDEQDERGLVPAALEGDEVSKRVADQKAEERIQERDDERADYDLEVKRVEDFEVVSRIEPERYAAVDAALPERVGQD